MDTEDLIGLLKEHNRLRHEIEKKLKPSLRHSHSLKSTVKHHGRGRS